MSTKNDGNFYNLDVSKQASVVAGQSINFKLVYDFVHSNSVGFKEYEKQLS